MAKNLSDSEILKLYHADKLSCSSISNIDGRSPTKIYFVLKKYNTKLRNQSEANKLFSDQILIKLYNIGLSKRQISRLLGIHETTITKRFNKINFPTRLLKTSKNIAYSDKEFNKFFMNNDFINRLKEII